MKELKLFAESSPLKERYADNHLRAKKNTGDTTRMYTASAHIAGVHFPRTMSYEGIFAAFMTKASRIFVPAAASLSLTSVDSNIITRRSTVQRQKESKNESRVEENLSHQSRGQNSTLCTKAFPSANRRTNAKASFSLVSFVTKRSRPGRND